MNQKVLDILNSGNPTAIRALFVFDKETDIDLIVKKFNIWSRYYFSQFFESKDAPFHKDIDLGNMGVYKNGGSFLNSAFRGSAKTTRIQLFIAFAIANDDGHYRKYIKILSKELSNATQATTDVYNMLVSRRIKALYPEIFQKTTAKREETMASFTTATGIKMTADTIGTDQRGDKQEQSRPDLILFDDFETKLSLMSAVITHKIWDNMEEAKDGLSKGGGIIYNCNYVSERGNVHKLFQKIQNKINIPIGEKIDNKWIPSWDRYTPEDVEKIERDSENFEGEYLGKPSASKDVYFDRESLDKQVPKTPIDDIAGLKIFKKYDPSHRIGSAHDVAGGVGLDSSTSCFMDFDCYPIQVAATYKNNEIKPDVFAHEIVRQAKRFGENYIAPEKNYGSTIDILKTIYPTRKIHQTERKNTLILDQLPTEYGWDTNSATKPKMLADFAKAIEDGIIELNDIDLINEAKSYTRNDLLDREVDPRLTTRHFDLLMAACICWQINKNIKAVEKKAVYDPYWPVINTKKVNPAR